MDAPSALSPADEVRIRSVDSAFVAAANAGDAEGVAAVYADDGALSAPNLPPQKGRAAIKAFWGGFLDAYSVRFEVVSEAGVADEGKFIEILKKQPDGSWKYVLDMYSSNLALQH